MVGGLNESSTSSEEVLYLIIEKGIKWKYLDNQLIHTFLGVSSEQNVFHQSVII